MKLIMTRILTSAAFASSTIAAEIPNNHLRGSNQAIGIIKLGNTAPINILNADLDTLLTNMTVGDQGRFSIGGASIQSAAKTIQSILQGNFNIQGDALSRFLICVSAQLKIEKGIGLSDATFNSLKCLIENKHVQICESDHGPMLLGFVGGKTVDLYTKDLMKAYALLKIKSRNPNISDHNANVLCDINSGKLAATAQFSVNPNNLFESATQLQGPILSALKTQGLKFSFVQMTPDNNIPYLLLKRNAAGKYEFPTLSENGDCTVNMKNTLQSVGNINTENWVKFDCFNTPAAIMVAHPLLDQKIQTYYEQQQTTHHQLPEFVFIRACNIAALATGIGQSPFYGVDASNNLFAKWNILNLPIDPSVLVGIDAFSYLRGFMSRVGDVDLDNIAKHWLQHQPIEQSVSAIAQEPVIAQNLYPEFVPIALSNAQNQAILALYQSLKDKEKDKLPDPKRAGAEFTDKELAISGVILQAVPNTIHGFLTGLSVVFSLDRAKAILNNIMEG